MNNLKQIRELYGATQEQIAQAINVNRVTVANWENGTSVASSSNQEKLSIYYGIGPEYFYEKELDEVAKKIVTDTSARAQELTEKSEGKRVKEQDFHKMFESITFKQAMEQYMFSMKMLLATADSGELDKLKAAALINKLYDGDPKATIKKAVAELQGSFAFCIMFKDQPGKIFAVRNVSPMVAFCIMFKDQPGKIFAVRNVSPMVATYCDDGAFIASDLTAFIKYSKRYFILPEYTIMTMTADGIEMEDLEGKKVEPDYLEVNWDVTAAQKDGYPHFMIKEIHEQPTAITRTITPRIKDSLPCFEDDNIPDSFFEDISDITVVACGTAMYAGMVGKALLKNKFGIPVSVEIASEFRYEQPVLTDRSMVIFVSQSGETIDTLEALRLANKYTKKTLSIVNVKGSTIARESNYVLYTHAGPEIAVASTKAYTVQVASFYLIGCKLGLVSGRMTKEEAKTFIENLQEVPNLIESVITQAPEIEQLTKRMTNAANAFYIGRGLDYALSMEGALKLKEISYIHAEAYAAGELKHGTIALISEGVPVIAVATQSHVYSKVISNIREVKARGAYVILLSKDKDITDKSICDVHISLPQAPDEFAIFESVIICQLIAYYTSTGKGLNPDQPRNLAKSVTVE